MEEQGGRDLVNRMARDVVRMQQPPAAAEEGADWQEPPGMQNGPQPGPAPTEVQRNAPEAAPTQPPAPELLGVDVKAGILFTSIGNFPIEIKERNRIAKACLRTIKAQLASTYTVMARGISVRQRAVRSDKGKAKPKRRPSKTAPGVAS